jgi:Zn-dependent protease with chaperone function
MNLLNWKTVGVSVGLFLAISYVLCVIYDLIFPGQTMYLAWIRLLPGFKWITWASFFLGLIETFLYGIYFALIFVPLYNFFKRKFETRN